MKKHAKEGSGRWLFALGNAMAYMQHAQLGLLGSIAHRFGAPAFGIAMHHAISMARQQ
jgi:hypothetical protein